MTAKTKKNRVTNGEPVSVGLGTYAGDAAAAAPEQCQPERDTAPKTGLTHKQQLFVEYYLKFLNSTEAAIAAGYTPANARQHAHRLMTNVYISDAIEKRMVERISTIGVDHTLVLIRLVAELKADVADLFNDNGSIKEVNEWPLVWRQGLVAGIEVYEEFDLQNEGGKKKKVLIGLASTDTKGGERPDETSAMHSQHPDEAVFCRHEKRGQTHRFSTYPYLVSNCPNPLSISDV